MGILDRTSTILRSNVNALLDQAEDPEQVLNQLIRDMANAVQDARGQVAEMIAQERVLEADCAHNLALATEWGDKATEAVRRGANDPAREALRRKLDFERNARAYGAQLQAQSEVVAKLEHDLQGLDKKYEDTAAHRQALIARHRAAVAQQSIARATAQLTIADPSSELARMDERLRREEVRAAAASETAGPAEGEPLAALRDDQSVDRQLVALQARAGGPATALGTR